MTEKLSQPKGFLYSTQVENIIFIQSNTVYYGLWSMESKRNIFTLFLFLPAEN